jgi:NAD(P)-dependent dehydrogenase (short-subunit alcohol dehydrogenase family)
MPTVRELSTSRERSTRTPTRQPSSKTVDADVSISADVCRYVAMAAARGPIDVVVHAAGVTGPAAPSPDFDEAEFDRVMAVNAHGAFLGMKYAFPHTADGGAIANIASVSGIRRLSDGRGVRRVQTCGDRIDLHGGAGGRTKGHPGQRGVPGRSKVD